MSPSPTVSVIIPTKNRRADLELTIRTLLRQTVLPQELLVVDQSEETSSRESVEAMLRSAPIALHYIHDPRIPGGAVARNLAMDQAQGEVLLFLDDDVEMEEDFLENLVRTYQSHPEISGVSGVITNYDPPDRLKRLWSRIFERGPFHDDRQPIYWQADQLVNDELYPVSRMTGALMSFRSRALGSLRFDSTLRGVSDGEDVDLCLRLGPQARLVINPRARLMHHRSAGGRLTDHWLHRYLRAQIYVYRRNWNHGIRNRVSLAWLLLGSALVASYAGLRTASLEPWHALVMGWREGKAAAG